MCVLQKRFLLQTVCTAFSLSHSPKVTAVTSLLVEDVVPEITAFPEVFAPSGAMLFSWSMTLPEVCVPEVVDWRRMKASIGDGSVCL